MGAAACYLGVDVGAESGRVMAGRWDGKTMRLEEMHRFSNGAVSLAGTLRWDVLRIWEEVRQGLAVSAKRKTGPIVSVAVDTWAIDYVLLSRSNEIVGQPFHYRDARTRGLVEEVCRRIPRQEIFAVTGLQFMELNTLYQLIATQRDHPELLAAADCLLMIPDFLHWCLCGAKVVEFTNATTTQFFNPQTRSWAIDLLRRLRLPTHILAPVVEPGTRIGALRPSVAEAAGFGSGVSVIAPATHDTASAVAAVPRSDSARGSWAYISSGTWSLIGVESSAPILSPRACQLNFTNEGGIDGTWRVLKNVMGLWLLQRCRAAWHKRGDLREYEELVRLAIAAPAFSSFVDPDDLRFLNPPDMPAAIRDFCRESGQREPESDGALIRCVLESLALRYRLVLRSVGELIGAPIEVVHIVGGGARNRLLNQFTANASGCEVIAGPVEATVFGNLLVQARSWGEVASLAEMRAIVSASSELERFSPAEADLWKEAGARFESICLRVTPFPGRSELSY